MDEAQLRRQIESADARSSVERVFLFVGMFCVFLMRASYWTVVLGPWMAMIGNAKTFNSTIYRIDTESCLSQHAVRKATVCVYAGADYCRKLHGDEVVDEAIYCLEWVRPRDLKVTYHPAWLDEVDFDSEESRRAYGLK